jgi:dTDP-4-dehydrorhamnose 3,5-epimerase
MSFTFVRTALPEVIICERKVYGDARGMFSELYRRQAYRDGGVDVEFVQDNHSRSVKGVLRGLHYQLRHPQGKLVAVVSGTIFDVAVDIRRGSPNFGKWVGVELSDDNGRELFVPAGFAHGFCVLSERVDVIYRCTDYYRPEDDRGILWSDPDIGIDWPVTNPILSERDRKLPCLSAVRDHE